MFLKRFVFVNWGNIPNLEFDFGPINLLSGGNGSGKTTLMRIIAGIYSPEAGAVYKMSDKKITAVFVLGAGLRPLFTGWENIYIEGAMYGMNKKEIDVSFVQICSFPQKLF